MLSVRSLEEKAPTGEPHVPLSDAPGNQKVCTTRLLFDSAQRFDTSKGLNALMESPGSFPGHTWSIRNPSLREFYRTDVSPLRRSPRLAGSDVISQLF